MSQTPIAVNVTKKVTASKTIATPVVTSTAQQSAGFEHIVHIGVNGGYEDEKVLVINPR